MPDIPIAGLTDDGRTIPYRDRLSVIFPLEYAASLAAWLDCADALLRGEPVPASARHLESSPMLRQVAHFVRRSAEDFARCKARSVARAAAIATSTHTPPPSPQDEITTTEAARQYGLSDETWRRYAKSGRLPARKGYEGKRPVWLLRRGDVIAELERRRTHGTGGSARPTQERTGDPGRAAAGSAGSRGRAA